MTHRQSRFVVLVCLVLTVLLAAGCSESPQEKYNDAMSKLNDAKKTRQQAQQKVSDARQTIQDDQKKLKEAQGKLDEANQKVATANHSVDKVVNDDVLFRTLQKKLLNDDQFSDAAISVGVNHRVVTLTGTVPDQDTRQQAAKVARSQAGVAHVNNQLQVPQKHDASDSKDQQKPDQKKSGKSAPNGEKAGGDGG